MTIDVDSCTEHLMALYRRQAETSDNAYLLAHSATRGGVRRQVEAARLYLPHVRGRVLDWGCFHAPDACLARFCLGDAVELFGCDVQPADKDCFEVFHRAAGLRYTRAKHHSELPYDDGSFDAVIADGALEHVPDDGESLKELYRVLRPDGVLVVSCLPNAWSYLENAARLLGRPHHLRTYTMRSAKAMLLHRGFEPLLCRHLQLMPTLSGLAHVGARPWLRGLADALWRLNAVVEPLWPLNRLASNLFLLARKRSVISWRKPAALRAA